MHHSYVPQSPPAQPKLKPHHPPRLGPRWALLPQQVRLRVVSARGQVLIERLRDAAGQEGDHERLTWCRSPVQLWACRASNSHRGCAGIAGTARKDPAVASSATGDVYVRQSSQYQVIHNKESAEVQSKLQDMQRNR